MPVIYGITDIFVNASSIEGLPMTILEAMASKNVLVVTPVGAVPKVVIHDVNGVLFNAGDGVQLAKEICQLIDQPKKRQRLTDQAYKDVCRKYSFESMAGHYQNVYLETLH